MLARACLILCITVVQAQIASAQSVSAALTDEQGAFDTFEAFDGALWRRSDGWSNGPHQGCVWRADAAQVENGLLRLSLIRSVTADKGYVCGEVKTQRPLGYGTYEARMRFPNHPGILTSFFGYLAKGDDYPEELIALQFRGRKTDQIQTNFTFGVSSRNEEFLTTPVDGSTNFLTYSIEWLPGSIRWYVEGTLVREVLGDDLPDRPMTFHLNFWNATDAMKDWLGAFSEPPGELVAEIDWFAYTPMGGACISPLAIRCRGATAAR